VRSALQSLQFVEKDKPIDADVETQQVVFTVTDKQKFDPDKVKEALKGKGFPKAEVLAGPK
jgi:hypothetical protein